MMSGEENRQGQNAFACGIARIGGTTVLVTNFGLAAYFIFLVWSFCEDLAYGGAPDLSDLAAAKDAHVADPIKMGLSIDVKGNYGAAFGVGGAIVDSSTIF